MRTIIDILRKGSQELFHSAMIGWLLDPKAEHDLGADFLLGFADALSRAGKCDLRDALTEAGPTEVRTEVLARRNRYDIKLSVGGLEFVIENKTKAVGTASQLDAYSRSDAHLIALGFSETSFSPEAAERHAPLMTYSMLVPILNRLCGPRQDPFGVLLSQYRDFLQAELGMLDLVDVCFRRGELERYSELAQRFAQRESCYTQNDRRFLNHHYLEMLRRRLDITPELKGTAWDRNKNQQSGVWLASKPSRISFRAELEDLLGSDFSDFWFHIEIPRHVCVCSGSLTEAAAVIQLRGSAIGDKHHALTAFRKVHPSAEGERAVTTLRKSSHFLIAKDVSRQNLPVDEMAQQVIGFMSRFGTFLP